MSEWQETTLGAVATKDSYGLVDGPFGSNLPASCYTKTGVPVIRGSNLSLNLERFKSNEFVFVSNETATRLARSLCKSLDIIFTKKGTLGQVGIIPEKSPYEKYLISSNQMKLTVDRNIADPLYIYYYVSSPASIEKIIRDSESTGVPKTNVAYLRSFPILLPLLPEQEAIARILSSLDDKIELNRRMNETLEAMARAIFKDWFVDFGPTRAKMSGRAAYLPEHIWSLFPEAIDKETGLPMGWKISTIGEECTFLNGYAFKSKDLVDNPQDAYHIFKMGNIKRGGGFNYEGTKSYFPVEKATDLQKYLLHKGDILMSMTDMKSSMALLGHTALMSISNIFLLNQRVGKIRANESSVLNFPYLFLYSNLEETIDDLRSRANSGVQVNLSTEEIKKTPILVPDEKAHALFDQISLKLFDLTFSNEKEVRTLTELRDRLLPKLMTGEIRVKAAEEMVEEVL